MQVILNYPFSPVPIIIALLLAIMILDKNWSQNGGSATALAQI